MKQLLQQYGAYNVWANKKIIDRISLLPVELVDKETPSSFPSIYKTLLHLWDVESIWLQRLKLAEHIEVPSASFEGNLLEMMTAWSKISQQWDQWITQTNEANLVHVFAYQNSKREQFKQPVYEMIMHLFNHQTYHRGQIITIFHAVGVDKIPATDFIAFCRKK